jgi:hypothetical protein
LLVISMVAICLVKISLKTRNSLTEKTPNESPILGINRQRLA